MKVLVALAALVAAFVLGYTAHHLIIDREIQTWKGKVSVLSTTIAVKDSAQQKANLEIAKLKKELSTPLPEMPKPRPPLALPEHPDDWKPVAIAALAEVNTLRAQLDTARYVVSVAKQREKTFRRILEADSLSLLRITEERDSAVALLHTAPVGKRACRILGVLPCPELQVGYGATYGEKLVVGPSVNAGWNIKLPH